MIFYDFLFSYLELSIGYKTAKSSLGKILNIGGKPFDGPYNYVKSEITAF